MVITIHFFLFSNEINKLVPLPCRQRYHKTQMLTWNDSTYFWYQFSHCPQTFAQDALLRGALSTWTDQDEEGAEEFYIICTCLIQEHYYSLATNQYLVGKVPCCQLSAVLLVRRRMMSTIGTPCQQSTTACTWRHTSASQHHLGILPTAALG